MVRKMTNEPYSSSRICQDVENKFAFVCKEQLDKFNVLCDYVKKINMYLDEYSKEDGSLEYYAKLVFERIKDHMLAATILIGKGFLIDGINIVRSSFEDLWLIQNIFLKENYFEEWRDGLGVRPWKLRQLKDLEEIYEENEMIYKALSNISHCSVASISHMVSAKDGMESIQKDYNLLIVSFYSSILQVVDGMISRYGEKEELVKINDELFELDIVNDAKE